MENSFTAPEQPQDLLNDLTANVQQASVGKRFANHLVDLVLYFIIFLLVFSLLIGLRVISVDLEGDLLGFRLIYFIGYGVWQGALEAIFKGKTLGKVFTKTRAVYEDGSPISASTAFGRGFSRLVPFEALSAFGGYPWHDRWTHTYVIDEKYNVN